MNLNENDVHLSYLPFAHSFEQILFAMALVNGIQVGFYSGNL